MFKTLFKCLLKIYYLDADAQLLTFFQAASQSYGFGVFTVQLPDEEVNFCIKYYPQLFNLSEHKNEAVIYNLDQLDYLKSEADTCSDDSSIPDLTDKIVLIPTQNKTINGNCSMIDRAKIIAGHNGIGVIADTPLSSKFNVTDYDVNIMVAAVYKNKDVQSILDLQKEHPSAKFGVYAPVMDKVRV